MRKVGSFVFTSSASSIVPFHVNPLYGATKVAADSLVRSFTAQLAMSEDKCLKSLSVMSINPAIYLTEMSNRYVDFDDAMMLGFAKMVSPSQPIGLGSELAETVLDLVNVKLSYKSGDSICVDVNTHFLMSEHPALLQATTVGSN
jgi:NAD(P)-dependent dehydrogenase (short-subunit alcohol dehydrogenase family)